MEDDVANDERLRLWSKLWGEFLDRHEQWWRRRVGETNEPVYTLPDLVIRELRTATQAAGNTRAQKHLISEADEKAENGFRNTCEAFLPTIVGVWREQPVNYPILSPVEVNLGVGRRELELIKDWDKCGHIDEKLIQNALRQHREKLVESRHQMLGYIGFLNLNKQFNEERNALRRLWQHLPPNSELPTASAVLLAPASLSDKLPGQVLTHSKVNSFYSSLREFIRRWNLSGFATWDLPLPQGPITALPVGLLSHLRGSETIVNYTPSYYDAPSKVNLRENQRDRQRLEGVSAGLQCEFPLTDISARKKRGGDEYEPSTYEVKFRLWFAASTLRNRYPETRGTMVRLDRAFSKKLGISEERMKKLRAQKSVGMN